MFGFILELLIQNYFLSKLKGKRFLWKCVEKSVIRKVYLYKQSTEVSMQVSQYIIIGISFDYLHKSTR